MTELNEIYKCEKCGNIVAMVHGGPGQLICCAEPMIKMDEQTADWTTEKHVPVIKRDGNLITITVGSTLHPMTDEHYIEWIELVAGDRRQRKYLKPGDPPEAQFLCGGDELSARQYCNLHGLWKS